MVNNTIVVGILNITQDSFFDGGRHSNLEDAIAHAKEMIKDGADIIDIGAESTHPDSKKVTAEEELEMLIPVVKALVAEEIPLAIDTHKASVMTACIELGAEMINDVTAFKDPAAIRALAGSDIPVVLMYARNVDAHAEKRRGEWDDLPGSIIDFFRNKIKELEAAGISKDRIIIDPGMGFFLGANPEPSLKVLKEFKELSKLGCKTYISTTNKSFIGSITDREVHERGAGTLATEIWASMQGANYIRTHNVRQLVDGLKMIEAIHDPL